MDVFIVTRILLLREMLTETLQADPAITSISELTAQTLHSTPEECPSALVIVDSSHPDGFALVAAARSRFPRIRVVVLAVYHRDEVFFAWADTGISGYLEPDASADELVATIRQAGAGEVVCPPRLTSLLLSRFTNHSKTRLATAGIDNLTGREREVLELLTEGLSNKRISRRLCIAEATVKNHIHSILQKLDLRSRGEAAACLRQSSHEHASHLWRNEVKSTRPILLQSRFAEPSRPATSRLNSLPS